MSLRELPEDFRLMAGSHTSFRDGACVMEAVAYVAGLPHSDIPRCACGVLTQFAITLNDSFSPAERQLLIPFIPRLAGSWKLGRFGDAPLRRKAR